MKYIVSINENLLLNSAIDTWIPEQYEILDDIISAEKEKGMIIPPESISVAEYGN